MGSLACDLWLGDLWLGDLWLGYLRLGESDGNLAGGTDWPELGEPAWAQAQSPPLKKLSENPSRQSLVREK